jgi:hypothetical protein
MAEGEERDVAGGWCRRRWELGEEGRRGGREEGLVIFIPRPLGTG